MIQDKILRSFAGKNILVTGGTGLIGRQVSTILSSSGGCVRIVSLDQIRVDPNAEHLYGDLCSFEFCKEVTKGIDFVFHIAGIQGAVGISETQPASHFVPTLMMNTNILEACRINKVKKVVYTSTVGAYSNVGVFKESEYRIDSLPMDFAGWAKRMAELQVEAYRIEYQHTNFYVVRPGAVYGPGANFDSETGMVIPSLMSRIFNKEDPVVIWGDGSAIRDFAFSRDVADGVILTLYHGTGPYPFLNLGSGVGYTIRSLVETLRTFIDFNYAYDTTKPAGYPKRVMDISLAKELIGYNPTTSLLEGLMETWEWFQKNKLEYLVKKNYFKED